jgi:hypothetical protein
MITGSAGSGGSGGGGGSGAGGYPQGPGIFNVIVKILKTHQKFNVLIKARASVWNLKYYFQLNYSNQLFAF